MGIDLIVVLDSGAKFAWLDGKTKIRAGVLLPSASIMWLGGMDAAWEEKNAAQDVLRFFYLAPSACGRRVYLPL
jgi:hypothetical protein